MGTPDLNLRGAMRLFHEIGLEGVEIRCTVDGQIDTERVSARYVSRIREWCVQYSMEVSCLTPYYRDFLQGEQSDDLKKMMQVIEVAEQLGCRNVRVYGGVDPREASIPHEEHWRRTAEALHGLGACAADHGVRLCVETHIGSLTMSADEVARFIDAVNHDAVGVLLDFAWVYLAGRESIPEVFDLIGSRIFHCHVKDWHIHDRVDHSKNSGCLLGQGDIPWADFLPALKKSGYRGWISDEYEKYWREEELPVAREGMRANLSYMRGVLESRGEGKKKTCTPCA